MSTLLAPALACSCKFDEFFVQKLKIEQENYFQVVPTRHYKKTFVGWMPIDDDAFHVVNEPEVPDKTSEYPVATTQSPTILSTVVGPRAEASTKETEIESTTSVDHGFFFPKD